MIVKNTNENYGFVAKCFHWVSAFLFLVAYAAVYYRHWFTDDKTPENWTALQIHLSVGISIAVIVVLRITWRVFNNVPDPEPGTRFEHTAAHIGHYALYAIIIIMPVTGYIGTGVNTEFFFMFDIAKFEDTFLFSTLVSDGMRMTFKAFEKPVDFIHKELLGAWIVWLLILGHVLAALYHHFIKKDRTIYKMTISK